VLCGDSSQRRSIYFESLPASSSVHNSSPPLLALVMAKVGILCISLSLLGFQIAGVKGSCEKKCYNGIPCGDTCIKSSETCSFPSGTACMGCLVRCKAGKPCGDSCISHESTCTKPKGHACAACCKTCTTGKACGDTCIAEDAHCDKPPGCACDAKPAAFLGADPDSLENMITDLSEGCLVHCSAGKPCGDSCIPHSSTCTKPKGRACGCCKTCKTGKACGDTCIAEDASCEQPQGCACNAEITVSLGIDQASPKNMIVGLNESSCAKVCYEGVPCGDACIENTKTCNVAPGAACMGCLVHCKEGQPCGDSCISANKTCTKPEGHACGGPCCKTCSTGKACGDTCIAEDLHCDQPKGCACDTNHREESPEEAVTNLAVSSCKTMCFNGVKPCGDSCIPLESTCIKPRGHACGPCCKTCTKGKACGDNCIAENSNCKQTHGCACNANEMFSHGTTWQAAIGTDLGKGSIDRINQKLELVLTQVASHDSNNNIVVMATFAVFASLVGIALAIANRHQSDRLQVPLLQVRP